MVDTYYPGVNSEGKFIGMCKIDSGTGTHARAVNDLVLYEDYAKLEAENKALKERLEARYLSSCPIKLDPELQRRLEEADKVKL